MVAFLASSKGHDPSGPMANTPTCVYPYVTLADCDHIH